VELYRPILTPGAPLSRSSDPARFGCRAFGTQVARSIARCCRPRSQKEKAMSSQLGPIDVCCDAPAYPIVHACERLGFQNPLDVRWCRLSRFPYPGDRDPLLGVNPWRWFTNRNPSDRTCSCGNPLPLLENFAFTLASERVIDYRLGQCLHCRTMFWEEG
jgi:hypothetical protein